MPRSWARGSVEPIAALAAVFVLGLGLTLYAGALRDERPAREREAAETVLSALRTDAGALGVLEPGRLRRVEPPANWSANLTLATAEGRWTRGDIPPPRARRATARVAVRHAPGRIVPGRLEVAVWR